MSFPDIDWNEIWRKSQSGHSLMRDSRFWDKRAPEFTRHATASDYIGQFIAIMQPEADWSVLDVGCAAGTLAVPLAPKVHSITAVDPSTGMLALFDERRRAGGFDNIRLVKGAWEDDWESLGIGMHDVAVASRSLIVEDLRGAVRKLESHARRRVYLSTLVDDGPYDRKIVEATGRKFHMGADYVLVYNILRQMGIYANVAFTVTREEKSFANVEEALNSVRWMIYEMTSEEEQRLRDYLRQSLVRRNGAWEMPGRHVVRWAVLWWEKE